MVRRLSGLCPNRIGKTLSRYNCLVLSRGRSRSKSITPTYNSSSQTIWENLGGSGGKGAVRRHEATGSPSSNRLFRTGPTPYDTSHIGRTQPLYRTLLRLPTNVGHPAPGRHKSRESYAHLLSFPGASVEVGRFTYNGFGGRTGSRICHPAETDFWATYLCDGL